MTRALTRRVFFAALPEPDTRRQLGALLRGLAHGVGRNVRVENLHLTLAYAGSVNEATLRCLQERAAALPAPVVEMSLDRFGCFARAAVLWLGPRAVPEDLSRLAGGLSEVLSECGLLRDPRAFAPHITLSRRVRSVPPRLASTPVSWRSCGFALMESLSSPQGVRYRVVRSYRREG